MAEISAGQLRLLLLLRDEGPLPMGRLGELMGVTRATGSGVINRLLTAVVERLSGRSAKGER
jgi:DNA-binding MarR family transcriptional regulator